MQMYLLLEATMKIRILFSLWMTALVLLACQPARNDQPAVPPEPEGSQPLATPEAAAARSGTMEASMTSQPDPIPPAEPLPPVTGEVPASLMDAILQDVSQRTGAQPAQVKVIRAQAVVWNDGSLGCPQPGMFYTQALVRGFWVVLELDGKTYDYHAAESGYFVLCENGQPPFGAPGLPDK